MLIGCDTNRRGEQSGQVIAKSLNRPCTPEEEPNKENFIIFNINL